MQITYDINVIPHMQGPIALTIGAFDALHIGHQYLIKQTRKMSGARGCSTVLTFSNQPSFILGNSHTRPPILSLKHRLRLFESFGVTLVIVIPFTKEFASLTYQDFLVNLQQRLPFKHLVLGEGACFGFNQLGNASNIQKIAPSLGFSVHYANKYIIKKEMVSSSLISMLIQSGDLKKIKKFLKRPYALYFSIANIDETIQISQSLNRWILTFCNLCPLPSGIYKVAVNIGTRSIPATLTYQSHIDSSHHVTIELQLTMKPQKIPLTNGIIEFLSFLGNDTNTKSTLLETLLLKRKSEEWQPSMCKEHPLL